MKFARSILVLMLSASISMAATFRSLPLDSKADFGATHVATITYTDLTRTNLDGSSQTLSNLCDVAAKQSVEMVAMVLVTPFVDNATNAHNSTLLSVGDSTSDTLFLTSTELNSNGTEVYIKFGRNAVAGTTATSTNVTGVAPIAGNVGTSLTSTTGTVVTGVTPLMGNVGTSLTGTTGTVVTGVTPLMGNVGTSLTVLTGVVTNGVGDSYTVVTGVTMNVSSIATNNTIATGNAVSNYTLNVASIATNNTIATGNALSNSTLNTSSVATNFTVTSAAQTRVTGITDTGAGVGTKVYTAADKLYFVFTGTSTYALSALDAGEVRCYFRLKDATKSNP